MIVMERRPVHGPDFDRFVEVWIDSSDHWKITLHTGEKETTVSTFTQNTAQSRKIAAGVAVAYAAALPSETVVTTGLSMRLHLQNAIRDWSRT